MLFLITWQKVMDGSKTLTTRRAFKYPDGHWHCNQVVGRSYCVQAHYGKRSIGRVKLTEVTWRERVRDISEEDGRSEGFASVEEYLRAASKLYSKKSLDEPAWGIRFVRVE